MRKQKKKAPQQDVKKHVSQMTEKEKTFLLKQFKSIPRIDWTFTPYAEAKRKAREISEEDFKRLWESFDLIEYHKVGNSSRVLMRSRVLINEVEVCVVFCLKERVVITIWTNWMFNQHKNLVIEAYQAEYDVVKGF